MKKIVLGEPVIVSQSTTEPIRHGGWQDPMIRCHEGKLYVRFSGVMDLFVNDDPDKKNPLFCSEDQGKTWTQIPMPAEGWTRVQKPLKNGDRVTFGGRGLIMDTSAFPSIDPKRDRDDIKAPNLSGVYSHEEFKAVVGDDADYRLMCYRVDGKTGEFTKEKCYVKAPNCGHGFIYHNNCTSIGLYATGFAEDKDGTCYLLASNMLLKDDGTLVSPWNCLCVFRSTDFCKSFEMIGSIDYKEEYNAPNAFEVEGFLEGCLNVADDGSFFTIMRSGSLSPYVRGSDDKPAPKCMISRSYDKGRTWTKPEVFYDYGVLPRSTRLGGGTFVMTSGRPDVYVRACFDGVGKDWGEVVHVLNVPKEDVYNAYEQYTCSNNDICAYDEHTAFLTYSNFQLTTPDGERAKSIIVQKVSVVEE